MAPKKAKSDTGQGKRKVVRKTIEVKKEIIAKHENGIRVSDLAVQYGMAKSTVCTILKNKDSFGRKCLNEHNLLIIHYKHNTVL